VSTLRLTWRWPLPQLRQVGYADGLAGGGYRPAHTWVALRAGRVVRRAAWALPPGAIGAPWREGFELVAEPEVGAALLAVPGRWSPMWTPTG
jgi:hypothetical protein